MNCFKYNEMSKMISKYVCMDFVIYNGVRDYFANNVII